MLLGGSISSLIKNLSKEKNNEKKHLELSLQENEKAPSGIDRLL